MSESHGSQITFPGGIKAVTLHQLLCKLSAVFLESKNIEHAWLIYSFLHLYNFMEHLEIYVETSLSIFQNLV